MIDNLMRRFNDWLTRRLYRQHKRQKNKNLEPSDD